MPNGFITLTTAGIVEAEADFAVEQIADYVPNPQDPNGGSIITLAFGASTPVMQTVAEIRALIAQEKDNEARKATSEVASQDVAIFTVPRK